MRQACDVMYTGRNIDVMGLLSWQAGVLVTYCVRLKKAKGRRGHVGYLQCKLTQRKRAAHGMVPCTALGMPAVRGNFVCIQFSIGDSQGKALYCADFVQRRCSVGT